MKTLNTKKLVILLSLSSAAKSFARYQSGQIRELHRIKGKSGKRDQSIHNLNTIDEIPNHPMDDDAIEELGSGKSGKSIDVHSDMTSHTINGGESEKTTTLEPSISLSMLTNAPSPWSNIKTHPLLSSLEGKSAKSEEEITKYSSNESHTSSAGGKTAKTHGGSDLDFTKSGVKSGKAAINTSMSINQSPGGKAEKHLSHYFVKTSSYNEEILLDLTGKSEKIDGYNVVHIETTTVTHGDQTDFEIIKAKSGKSDGAKGGKSDVFIPTETIASSDCDNRVDIINSTPHPSSESNKPPSSSPVMTSSSSKSSEGPSVMGSSETVAPTLGSGNGTGTSITIELTDDTLDSVDSGGLPDDTVLLTLSPTPVVNLMTTSTLAPSTGSGPDATGTTADNRSKSSAIPTTLTYAPTLTTQTDLELSDGGETSAAIDPFALRIVTDSPTSKFDPEVVRTITMEHLVHSFRSAPEGYVLNRLNLMLLDPEGERLLLDIRYLQTLDEYRLVFGGILYFPAGKPIPSIDVIDSIVHSSLANGRLEYYVQLLQEADQGVGSVSFDEDFVKSRNESGSSDGQKWRTISVSLAGAVGGLALVATGVRIHYKKHLFNETKDIEHGRFVFKLKDDDEVEEFPGLNACTSTVANTENGTFDDGSLRSANSRHSNEDAPSLNSRSLDAIEEAHYASHVSPLEEPPIRYISVFTVKKDVQGKSLDRKDLRSLAITYLSKLLKKFPNTFLLPFDKESHLDPITNIRNIPDDLDELEQYIGNPRVDEGTGKVMFNLRVESDMPVSKMKNIRKNSANVAPPPPPPEMDRTCCDNNTDGNDEEREESKEFEDVSI